MRLGLEKRPALVVLVRRNKPFQFLEPIEDDVDLRGSRAFVGSNHHEPAIRRYVIVGSRP